MGCYDFVRFDDEEYTLPDGLVAGNNIFQTKSLDGNLNTLIIGYDGSLILDERWILFNALKLVFYALVLDEWHEYNAYFYDGKLTTIEVAK